jgi:hypothetical protein
MMTPMGRGGYMYRRGRRWPRVLAALLVVLLIAAVAAGVWWWSNRSDDQANHTAGPTRVCHTPVAKQPKVIPDPAAVNVNVANGTSQAGLAIQTADGLAGVGFTVVGIGNTASPVKKGVAEIRYGDNGLGGAIRLASYVPGGTLVPLPQRKGDVVDFWIGPKYNGLTSSKQADVQSVKLPTPKPVCHKVHSSHS